MAIASIASILIFLASASSGQSFAQVPLPRPTNPHVAFDRYSLRIDGKPVFLASGEFEYWRLPAPELWPEVMARMRAAGLNTITVYLPWAYHSPAQDVYDFTGIRDLDRFLQDAYDAGLYVVARPGPFIDAESYGGQIPGWLFSTKAPFRSADPGYLAAVAQWYDHVLPIVARHQIGHGGSVVLMQIENELIKGDPKFIETLYRMARARGIDVPLIHNDVPLNGDPASIGIYSSVVDISTPDNYPGNFECLKPWTVADIQRNVDPLEHLFRDQAGQTGIPLLIGEYQGGTFDPYGGAGYDACYERLGPDFVDVAYKSLIAQGATGFNEYMFYGGTTWGYMPNALVYTSYDYGAPMREWFALGPRYDAAKRLGYFLGATGDLIARTDPRPQIVKSENPSVSARGRVNPESDTEFLFVRNDDEKAAQSTKLALGGDGASVTIPRRGNLRLERHGMKVLLAKYSRSWGTLDYSTSELLTEASASDGETVVLWGDNGDDGETSLSLPSADFRVLASPGISVERKGQTLLLDYKHLADLQFVRVESHERKLVLVLADRAAAGDFWRVGSGDATMLVYGGCFVTAGPSGHDLDIRTASDRKGDDEKLLIFSGAATPTIAVNGESAPVRKDPLSGAMEVILKRTKNDAKALTLPALSNWSFVAEPFEADPAFDDRNWSPVNAYRSLSPDAHDFSYGFVWYRGKFRSPAGAKFLRLRAYDSYSVWLNGHYLGSGDGGAVQTFPVASLLLGRGVENTVAVLAESVGRADNVTPSGLTQAELLAEEHPAETERLDPLKPADSKRFQFSPEWAAGSDGFWGDQTVQTATKAGARVKFSFRGPLLRILGPYGPDRGQAEVWIDGKKAGEIDASRAAWDGGSGPLFERTGWDDGEHTAEIVVIGQRHTGSAGPRFAISAIETGPAGSAALPVDIAWKLEGANGEVRARQFSPFNGSGLYGEIHGWPAAPPLSTPPVKPKPVTLPHVFNGADEWVGWFSTTVDLDIPADGTTELGFQFDGVANHGDKALLYVNGFLYGRYWPDKGPQTKFFLPRGVWKPGKNLIAIAVWRRDAEGGRLGKVELKPYLETQRWSVAIH